MILCCGEALIDMLPRETTKGEAAFAPYAGGAVCNTAVALARLGRPTGFFCGLSSDLMGDIIREKLDASNVDHSHVAISDRPTTLAFVKLVNGAASYAFYDENTAGRMITEADLPTIGDDCSAMHFGAISLIPEPCGSTYEALLMREAESRVISLDPNIRPGFITDADKHRARIERMAAKSDIVKFSDEDLDWFGLTGSLEERAPPLADGGREPRRHHLRRRRRNRLHRRAYGQGGERESRGGRHRRRRRHVRCRHSRLARHGRSADQGKDQNAFPRCHSRCAGTRRQGRRRHRVARRREPALRP